MGLLQKLWDETVAGPAPESGLGRLRNYNSFSAVRSPNHPLAAVGSRSFRHRDRPFHDPGHDVPVSRSITILRTKSIDHGSASSSPTLSNGSSSPMTPVTPGTPRDPDVKRFTRKKQTLDSNAEASNSAAYDWVMISALDR